MDLKTGFAVAHVILFLIAAVFIYRSKLAARDQKRLQTFFAGFLPILGPMFTIIVHWGDVTKPGKLSQRYIGQSIDEAPADLKLQYFVEHNSWDHIRNRQKQHVRSGQA